ncbi:WGR and DUF4132 domain-containing protein [Arachnia propionica]|uniref:DUF4132 domain-containing protein n=1 Tax=Arachnia propionica TaxID=1750 RepID=A0A3P1WRN8_9ACTN|nr:DUF4132 domain-containing protein [Arachnia propionica]RRD48508.1 DUF4132 domain-containing protein [Arachnia propionica]
MQRRLSLTEGSSDKFWYIDVVGDSVTVRYGRRGSDGTTRTKQYATAEKALAEAEKQVTAKLRKGYSDEDGAPEAALTPVEPTNARTAGMKQAKRTVEPEPEPTVLEPMTVSDVAADDLGLRVSPFELGYDLSREVTIESDITPIDLAAEEERATRLLASEKILDDPWDNERLATPEPLFTTVPDEPRRRWWARRIGTWAEENLPARKGTWGPPPSLQEPRWLGVVLKTNWEAKAKSITLQLRNRKVDALVARGVLALRSEEERQAAIDALPSPLPPLFTLNQVGMWRNASREPFLAAALSCLTAAQARELYEQVPAKGTADFTQVTALSALLLPTPEERAAFARRTKAPLTSWDEVVPWLIATGHHGFDTLLRHFKDVSKGEAETSARCLAEAAHGPGMTPLFLDLLATKAARVAQEWLTEHVAHALAAELTPTRAETLKPTLRALPVEQLRQVLDDTTGPTRAALEEIIAEADTPELPADTDWWVAAATDLPRSQKLPFDVTSLPPLLVADHRLGPDQVKQLLRALSAESEHPLVTALRRQAETTVRDRFAVALFRAWIGSGAPSRQGWCMTGAGWLGDSTFIHELTPLLREWPGQSQHQRAVKGLTALRNVATDSALQAISGIAAKVKFAGLKKRAGEAMDEIAEQRGLSRDELEDRILPDGGLDERGTRIFSYGTRRFLAHVTPDGRIAARLLDADDHPSGKVLTSLPAPNKSDDQARATVAKAEFAAMKKDLTAMVKIQTTRFEQAMVQDRRWNPRDHATLIAPHPVLRRLLAGVVWGVHAADGSLAATARIDEDGTLTDPDDDPIEIPDDGSVSIVHPLDLTDEQLSIWGEVLADYELTTPFRQLDRPTFTLPRDQGDAVELKGLPEGRFPATKLLGAFTRYGWQRGKAYDAGVYCIHFMPVSTADLTVVARYDSGLWMGSPADQEDQTLVEVHVVKGLQDADALGWGERPYWREHVEIPWSQVPPRIVSEVLATINQIAS